MNKISDKWMKVILWASSYVSAIAFALVGGYVFINTDKDNIKNETKKVLIVTLIYVALGMFVTLFGACMSFGSYSAGVSKAYAVISALIAISKIIVYVVFVILALVSNNDEKLSNKQKNEQNAEEIVIE